VVPLAELELRRPAPSATRECSDWGRFHERAAREAGRFRLATDSEYWIALCFRRASGAAAFAAVLGLRPDGGCLPGPQLEEPTVGRAVRREAPRLRRLDAVRPAAGRPLPGPLTQLTATSDLGVSAAAELAALHEALTAPAGLAADVLDSPHHLVAYWPHRAAKDAWLARTGLDALGDKYLDGAAAVAVLGLPHQHAGSTLATCLRFSRVLTLRRNIERTSRA
jgi:hypothetical protein